MSAIEEIRKIRIEKLKKIQASGIDPYPAKSKMTIEIADALESFEKLKKTKKEIVLTGRIRGLRGHGGVLFFDIAQEDKKIQVFLKKDKVGENGFRFFQNVFDIGDFIEVRGLLCVTKTGEKTIEANGYRMLAKSILPLPEKWHGLQDEEERLRKRYLDILFNPDERKIILKRDIFWNSFREFLKEKKFIEVETPILEIKTGGADARPFMTHHNALNIDVFLRISVGELWQKRLMASGFLKTFEIGRVFRNEGMDAEHLQDYTAMEFYWAYADYEQGMRLVEEMYEYVAKKTFGTLKFKIKEFEIDLNKKWEKYDYRSTIQKVTGIDVLDAGIPEIEKKLKKLGVEYAKKGFNRGRAIDSLWKYCRKQIVGPGFLINLPVIVSPLAKRSETNPKLTQRFQVILAGSELGNGYSELNNPLDQDERFKEQQKLRDKGDEEAQMYDEEFVEMLEYGMPPTCGFGVSERLFAFLVGKPMRECQIFPLMKSR